MRPMGKTAFLLFLSHKSLSSISAADNVNEIISRLDSLKNSLLESYLKDEDPQELEPLLEPDTSLSLNNYFEDEDLQDPEPEHKLMLNETKDSDNYEYKKDYDHDGDYDNILKIRDVIEKIPDIVVRKSIQNHFNLAQTEMHEYLERHIPEAKSEEKAQLQGYKENMLRYFDDGFENMVIKSEREYAPEIKRSDISNNKMIDTIPASKNYDDVDLETTNVSESKGHDLTKQEIKERLENIIKDQQMIKDALKKMGDTNG